MYFKNLSQLRAWITAVVFSMFISGIVYTANAEDTLPTRKSGLWQQKTTMDQGDGPQGHTLTICIEKSMEERTARASILSHQQNCSQYDISRTNGKTSVISECVFNGRKVSSTTTMSGDFQKSFNIEIVTRTTLKDRGQTRVAKRKIDQKGTFLTSDCGDLKPGEAKGENGERIMVQ